MVTSGLSWEQTQINTILEITSPFMHERNFILEEVIKNNRDGGYVSFRNRYDTINVTITFLPNLDILIYYKINVFKFLIRSIFRMNKKEKVLSIRDKIHSYSDVEELRTFLKDGLRYIDENNLLK